MKSKIISQAKNPFLKREEITLEITSGSSPTESEAKEQIGKDESLTVIKKINTNFGRQTFLVEAVVYNDAKAKEEIETIPQKVRKKIEADKKAAEEDDHQGRQVLLGQVPHDAVHGGKAEAAEQHPYGWPHGRRGACRRILGCCRILAHGAKV